MTNQEVFDKVKEHLLNQNQRAYDLYSGCKYRVPNTSLKCAIGCLITDDIYDEKFEGQSIEDLLTDNSSNNDRTGHFSYSLSLLFKGVDIGLLKDLQMLHDYSIIEHWPSELDSLAFKWKLKK